MSYPARAEGLGKYDNHVYVFLYLIILVVSYSFLDYSQFYIIFISGSVSIYLSIYLSLTFYFSLSIYLSKLFHIFFIWSFYSFVIWFFFPFFLINIFRFQILFLLPDCIFLLFASESSIFFCKEFDVVHVHLVVKLFCHLVNLQSAVHFIITWLSGIIAITNINGDSASPWKIPFRIFTSAKILHLAVTSTLQFS